MLGILFLQGLIDGVEPCIGLVLFHCDLNNLSVVKVVQQ